MLKCTIFIPLYNGEKFLRTTLDSIAKQTSRDFKVYCVDDGSSDRTCDIVREYCQRDSRFVLFRKKNEGSVPFSWRYVLPLLESEYVQYLSQDDFLEPDYMEKMDRCAQENGADAVVPVVEYYQGESRNRIKAGWHWEFTAVIDGRQAYEAALDYSIPGFCWWRCSIVKAIPFYCDAFNSDELMQRLWFRQCQRVAFSSALFYYRQNNSAAITKHFSYAHYSSLRTNMHLLDSMRSEGIPAGKEQQLGAHYFQGLFVMMRQAAVHRKKYSSVQRRQLSELFRQAFNKFSAYAAYCEKKQGAWRVTIYQLCGYSFHLMQMTTFVAALGVLKK